MKQHHIILETLKIVATTAFFLVGLPVKGRDNQRIGFLLDALAYHVPSFNLPNLTFNVQNKYNSGLAYNSCVWVGLFVGQTYPIVTHIYMHKLRNDIEKGIKRLIF